MPPQRATFDAIATRHRAVFLDAYGVLVDEHGAIPHAASAIDRLERAGKPWFVLTNDASRLPGSMAARFQSFGLAIPTSRIIGPGDLLGSFFADRGLRGARTVVLGSPDSHALVRDAGADLVDLALDEDADFEVLVLADQSGFPMLETLDRVVTGLLRGIERGREPTLVLPNPDRVYPKRAGVYGVATGSIAALIEEALVLRARPGERRTFVRLGKPFAPLFEAACTRAGTRDAVLFGDQLLTDVRGANALGLASALVGTGLARFDELEGQPDQPTYMLEDLR